MGAMTVDDASTTLKHLDLQINLNRILCATLIETGDYASASRRLRLAYGCVRRALEVLDATRVNPLLASRIFMELQFLLPESLKLEKCFDPTLFSIQREFPDLSNIERLSESNLSLALRYRAQAGDHERTSNMIVMRLQLRAKMYLPQYCAAKDELQEVMAQNGELDKFFRQQHQLLLVQLEAKCDDVMKDCEHIQQESLPETAKRMVFDVHRELFAAMKEKQAVGTCSSHDHWLTALPTRTSHHVCER